MKIRNFLANLPLGILIGSVSSLLLAFAIDIDVREEAAKFYTYLLSAAFSLTGAGLAVMGVLHNVENQNRLTAFQREKRLLSAKAMLPAALVGLTEIADEALETIR